MPITPTVGRIVHVYAVEHWHGPRPGIIVSVGKLDVGLVWADVRVFLREEDRTDGVRDFYLSGQQIYDPMTAPMRDEGTWGQFWCEWMPYQVGQAAKNDDDIAALRKRIEQLEISVGGIRN